MFTADYLNCQLESNSSFNISHFQGFCTVLFTIEKSEKSVSKKIGKYNVPISNFLKSLENRDKVLAVGFLKL